MQHRVLTHNNTHNSAEKPEKFEQIDKNAATHTAASTAAVAVEEPVHDARRHSLSTPAGDVLGTGPGGDGELDACRWGYSKACLTR